jgi:hypothetical protein
VTYLAPHGFTLAKRLKEGVKEVSVELHIVDGHGEIRSTVVVAALTVAIPRLRSADVSGLLRSALKDQGL